MPRIGKRGDSLRGNRNLRSFNPPTYPYTLGLKQDPYDERDYKAVHLLTVRKEDLPDSISYRSEMTPVKSQGNMGSCSSFCTVAVREWEQRLDPKRLPMEDLSELFLYQKTKEIDPWDSQGTSLRFTLKALKRWGCGMEEYYPYRDEYPIKTEILWDVYGRARWHKIKSYHRLHTKEEMKRWLAEHSPFILGIPVGYEIFNPEPPDYEVPPPSHIIGGHGLCVVGYDEKGRFEFKNSWSKSYADQGYAKLSADYLDKVPWFDGWTMTPDFGTYKE